MRRVATLFLIPLAACARPSVTDSPSAPVPVPLPSAAASPAEISATELRNDLAIFASDSFLGRSATAISGVKAARFLAARLAAIGVEPAGDSGYFQRVPLSRQAITQESSFAVTSRSGTVKIPLGADGLVPLLSLGQGSPLPKTSADAEIVFLGYGLTRAGRDDFANLSLAGKTVVFVNSAPANADSAERAQLETQGAVGARLPRIIQQNPAAVIVLLAGAAAEQYPLIASQLRQGSTSIGEAPDSAAQTVLPMILLGVPRAGSPLLPAGWPRDDRAQVLAGTRFNGRVITERQPVPAYNVIGVIRGTDAALSNSFVAFGAHLDHVGIESPVNGDSIANGADDDGSGSVALLAIARAMKSLTKKPARSALFVWHTAEELGLLGSEYFTEHPTVPVDSIAAQLNADMIGRNATDSLYIVGPLAAPKAQSSVLGMIVDSVNATMALPFKINREWDSPNHPERIYYRSDHYSYARRGVPIVFFTSGLHEDYHKVSDEIQKIDFDKLARVATLILRSGIAVANRPTRPLPTAQPATP